MVNMTSARAPAKRTTVFTVSSGENFNKQSNMFVALFCIHTVRCDTIYGGTATSTSQHLQSYEVDLCPLYLIPRVSIGLAASGLLGDGSFQNLSRPLALVLVLGRLRSAFNTGTSL